MIIEKIINILKRTESDEKEIEEVCYSLLDSNFINNSECLLITALLAKYFKSQKIRIKVHFGFIGKRENPTKVIESHLWLSYKKKRIDITAHKQYTKVGDFSSEAYILNEPIANTKSDIYFTKGLNKASKIEKKMLHDKVKTKNKSSVRFFESASANKDSSIDFKLIEEFMNNPYDLEKRTKEELDKKYERFMDIINPKVPDYLKNTSIGKLLD